MRMQKAVFNILGFLFDRNSAGVAVSKGGNEVKAASGKTEFRLCWICTIKSFGILSMEQLRNKLLVEEEL